MTRSGTGGTQGWWVASGRAAQWSTLAAVAQLSKAELNEMVAEAIIDAHDEEEARSGFYDLLIEELAVPFETTVLGVAVTVEDIDLSPTGIAAICVRGEHRQAIPLSGLPLPEPPPAGAEWIAAYRHWADRLWANTSTTSSSRWTAR